MDESVPAKEVYKAAIRSFLILNLIFLSGPTLIIYSVHRLSSQNEPVEKALSMYSENFHVSSYLMYCSATLIIINGGTPIN